MAIRGSCLCGGVRFEVERAAGPFELCHCTRCRKRSGGASLPTVVVHTRDYRMVAGEDLIEVFEAPLLYGPPAYRSTFCSRCGSPVPPARPQGEQLELPAGLLDDDPGVRPERHIFVELRAGWDRIADGLPEWDLRQLVQHRHGRELAPDFEVRRNGQSPAVQPSGSRNPAEPYRLVPATPEDRAWLETLRRAVYQELFVATWGAWDEARHQRHCAECWERGGIHVVEVDGARVGMIQQIEHGDAIEVGEIQIHPSHQGKGTGSRLLEDALTQAHSRGQKVVLSAGSRNHRAIRLYERLVFQPGFRGETHVHMESDSPGRTRVRSSGPSVLRWVRALECDDSEAPSTISDDRGAHT